MAICCVVSRPCVLTYDTVRSARKTSFRFASDAFLNRLRHPNTQTGSSSPGSPELTGAEPPRERLFLRGLEFQPETEKFQRLIQRLGGGVHAVGWVGEEGRDVGAPLLAPEGAGGLNDPAGAPPTPLSPPPPPRRLDEHPRVPLHGWIRQQRTGRLPRV